jgi:hypothetical protein
MFNEIFGVEYTVDCLVNPTSNGVWEGQNDLHLDVDRYRLWVYTHLGKYRWSVEIAGTDYTLIEGAAQSLEGAKRGATQMYKVIVQGIGTIEQFERDQEGDA